MVAIDLSIQQALDADLKAIQITNSAGNLSRAEAATVFFIIEEVKETTLDCWQGTVGVLKMCSSTYFHLI